jgi:hypothetical protein
MKRGLLKMAANTRQYKEMRKKEIDKRNERTSEYDKVYNSTERPVPVDISKIPPDTKQVRHIDVTQSVLARDVADKRLAQFMNHFRRIDSKFNRLLNTQKIILIVMNKAFGEFEDLQERTNTYLTENDVPQDLVEKYKSRITELQNKQQEVKEILIQIQKDTAIEKNEIFSSGTGIIGAKVKYISAAGRENKDKQR